MKHELYKMLFDSNPDGSVTYTKEDMKKITEEDEFEQAFFKRLLGDSFDILLKEIQKRIEGIAEFAYGDEHEAIRIFFDYADVIPSPFGIATVYIDLWGEKLNNTKICQDGEQIERWQFSNQSKSHQLIFTRQVPRELITRAKSLWD